MSLVTVYTVAESRPLPIIVKHCVVYYDSNTK